MKPKVNRKRKSTDESFANGNGSNESIQHKLNLMQELSFGQTIHAFCQ